MFFKNIDQSRVTQLLPAVEKPMLSHPLEEVYSDNGSQCLAYSCHGTCEYTCGHTCGSCASTTEDSDGFMFENDVHISPECS